MHAGARMQYPSDLAWGRGPPLRTLLVAKSGIGAVWISSRAAYAASMHTGVVQCVCGS